MKTLLRLFIASFVAFALPVFADQPVATTWGIMPGGQDVPGAPVTITNGPSTPIPSMMYLGGAVISSSNPLPTSGGFSGAHALQGTITTATSLTLTPPANTNLRLLHINVSDNATQSTAGVITITATLNGVVVYVGGVYVPASALDNAGSLMQVNLNFSAVAPNAGTGSLVITLSGALSAGDIFVNAYFD
ncbi:MAG: hypothetical protein ACP5D5_09345 [Acidithiobacillus sp.]|uniref:hypothetical protein n=1 Tax=Acidithiobacillus sp. TaxID=1872118 RepID=UPI003D0228D5